VTTPANNPARASTSPERGKYREDGQWADYGLVIHRPVTVYSARINQSFSTHDEVIELTYDGGSGTLADVIEGMLVFIGSTACARDKGITVLRKAPTSTVFYIRPTSKIDFANNDYITIVDAFQIAGKPIKNQAGSVQMNTDIEFGDLTRGGVIARLGPLAAVIEQTSGTLTFVPPNPEESAAYDGAAITGYEFEAPGASSTSDMDDEENASWTYPLTADGQYRWNCIITDDLTRETVGYRRVFVNPPEIPFRLEGDVEGSLDSGDWKFEVTAYADVEDLFEGAMIILYRREYHGGALENIGKLQGFENIEAIGWIDGDVVEQDDHMGWYTFSVYGPGHWMAKTQIDPLELRNTLTDPANWNEIEAMTVDKILARILYWMTTAPIFMDCFFTGSDLRLRTYAMQGGSIWDVIKAVASDKIFATPGCNNYGQLFVRIDPQLAASAERATYPVVIDITLDDYEGMLDIERNTSAKTALLQLDALQNADGVTDIFLYSRAPGNAPDQYGDMSSYQDHIVADAADCRRIAGRLLATENNDFEPLTIIFPSNISLFDIAPPMVATLTTDGSDNPRGIALTNQRLIPRAVRRRFENGVLRTEVTFEFEVSGVDGVDYFPPTAQDDNLDDGFPGFDGVDFPTVDPGFGETVPPSVGTPCNRNIGNYFSLNFRPRNLVGSTSIRISKAYFPCKIRAAGGLAGDTHIQIRYKAYGDAESHKACYAVNGDGNRVLTGSWVGNVITFSPVSDTEITGFEIELDEGTGDIIEEYKKGTRVLESGPMGTPTTVCEPTKWYAIEPYTGFWEATYPPEVVDLAFFNFYIPPGNSPYNSGVGRDGFGAFHLDYWRGYGTIAQPSNPTEVFNPETQEFEHYFGMYGTIFFQAANVEDPQVSPSGSGTLTLGVTYQGMRWRMYEAEVIGRKLSLGGATLHNVCALDE